MSNDISHSSEIARTSASISDHRSQQSWAEIASRIDGIAGLHTQGDTNAKDSDEQGERHQPCRRRPIPAIRKRAHNNEEDSRAQELG